MEKSCENEISYVHGIMAFFTFSSDGKSLKYSTFQDLDPNEIPIFPIERSIRFNDKNCSVRRKQVPIRDQHLRVLRAHAATTYPCKRQSPYLCAVTYRNHQPKSALKLPTSGETPYLQSEGLLLYAFISNNDLHSNSLNRNSFKHYQAFVTTNREDQHVSILEFSAESSASATGIQFLPTFSSGHLLWECMFTPICTWTSISNISLITASTPTPIRPGSFDRRQRTPSISCPDPVLGGNQSRAVWLPLLFAVRSRCGQDSARHGSLCSWHARYSHILFHI